jgi:regulator of protease activity HflC (stomatin/prohibitin superfamily)
MTEATQPDLPKDATAEQIEADIIATRARLSESVDALADKVDVKGQAQRKVADTKAQATEKVNHAKVQAEELVGQAKAQASDTVGAAKEQVVSTSQTLLDRFKAASRPVQVSIGAAPVALLILLIVRRARR